MSETFSGALSLWHSAGWWPIHLIQRTFNTCDRFPEWSFTDIAGGTAVLSDNLNAAAPPCWKFDQNALTISSVSETYPTVVICLIWAQDSFCVTRRFGCPATSPKCRGPWPFCAISFALPLSSFPSHYQYLSYPMQSHRWILTHYCFKQTALQQLFRKGFRLWVLTASSRLHLAHGKNWPPLRQHVVW